MVFVLGMGQNIERIKSCEGLKTEETALDGKIRAHGIYSFVTTKPYIILFKTYYYEGI